MTLNFNQRECLRIAKLGHNLAILGQAGVGKTFIVNHLKNELGRLGLRVAVTCTTGIACANYRDAVTIHSFCGIKDGRYSLKDMEDVLAREDAIREKLCRTDGLIIDEISMLSYKMLCQVEAVCRMARNNQQMFGGMQMIVSGDFFQLQPVPNLLYGDRGDFAFSGPLWNDAFPHHVLLEEVMRQKEHQLIEAIRETSRGSLSPGTDDFLTSLSRPLDGDQDFVMICATNQQADMYNQKEILRLKGDLKTFQSEDLGEKRYLDRMVAPKSLWVKVGCKVMLLRNLSDGLVNGSTGVVTDIADKHIDVDFQGRSSRIVKYTFGVYNPNLKCDVAKRYQFPLKLCYALTVHKSQGMTIDRLQVDCEGIFRPGQLGVAIGRARTIQGLQVLNFQPHWVIPQDDIIFEFYTRTSMLILENKDCCQHISPAGEDTVSPVADGPSDVFDDDDDFDLLKAYEECMGEAEEESDDEGEDFIIYEQAEAMSILRTANPNVEVTDFQKDVKMRISQLEQSPDCVVQYCNKSANLVSKSYARTVSKSTKNENINEFYKECHTHLISTRHKNSLESLFGDSSKVMHYIAYKMFTNIRERFLHSKSEESLGLEEEDLNPRSSPSLNKASRAKIRYISGYCFQKIQKKCSTSIRQNMFKVGSTSFDKVQEAYRKKKMIGKALRKQKQLISETADYASLSEVLRKQNLREGLTNVSDDAFDFSVLLGQKCIGLQTEANMHSYGKHFHFFVSSTLQSDQSLFQKWLNVFPIKGQTEEKTKHAEMDCLDAAVNFAGDLIEMFNDFTETFTRIMSKQFVRDILEKWGTKKKEAHRKEIKIRKVDGMDQSEQGETSVTSQVQGRGRGARRGSGSSRRGRGARRRGSGRDSGVSGRGSGRDSGVSGRGSGRDSGVSGRGRSVSARGKGKGKAKKTLEIENPCGICGEESYIDCVACDMFDKWFHGNCLKIFDLDSLPDEWFCPQCDDSDE